MGCSSGPDSLLIFSPFEIQKRASQPGPNLGRGVAVAWVSLRLGEPKLASIRSGGRAGEDSLLREKSPPTVVATTAPAPAVAGTP